MMHIRALALLFSIGVYLVIAAANLNGEVTFDEICEGKCVVIGRFKKPVGTLMIGTVQADEGVSEIALSVDNIIVKFSFDRISLLKDNGEEFIPKTFSLEAIKGREILFFESFSTRDFPVSFFGNSDTIPKSDVWLGPESSQIKSNLVVIETPRAFVFSKESQTRDATRQVSIDELESGSLRLLGRFSQKCTDVLEGDFEVIPSSKDRECVVTINSNLSVIESRLSNSFFCNFKFSPLGSPKEEFGIGMQTEKQLVDAFKARRRFRFFERLVMQGLPKPLIDDTKKTDDTDDSTREKSIEERLFPKVVTTEIKFETIVVAYVE